MNLDNNNRIRDFEIECANKCQSLEIEQFKSWLDVEINRDLLQSYAHIKLNYVSNYTALDIYELHDIIEQISNYIYTRYKYNFVNTSQSEDTISIVDPDELVELDEDDEFENDMINILSGLHTSESEEPTEEMLLASLRNDMDSAYLFQEMMNRISESFILLERKKFVLEKDKEKFDPMEEKECSICYENIQVEHISKLNCGHEFCNTCLVNTIKSDKRKEAHCAYCRTPIKKIYVKNEEYFKLFDH